MMVFHLRSPVRPAQVSERTPVRQGWGERCSSHIHAFSLGGFCQRDLSTFFLREAVYTDAISRPYSRPRSPVRPAQVFERTPARHRLERDDWITPARRRLERKEELLSRPSSFARRFIPTRSLDLLPSRGGLYRRDLSTSFSIPLTCASRTGLRENARETQAGARGAPRKYMLSQ